MSVNNFPVFRKEDIVTQELNGEVLIYDLKNHNAYCLNETSAMVWQACDGSKSAAQIASALGEKLDQNISEDYVWLAIDQLKEKQLVDCPADRPVFAGMNRREVIRKVGLSTLVALPVISMLAAPTAAQAQSGGVCGTAACSCTFNNNVQPRCQANGQQCPPAGTPGGQCACIVIDVSTCAPGTACAGRCGPA